MASKKKKGRARPTKRAKAKPKAKPKAKAKTKIKVKAKPKAKAKAKPKTTVKVNAKTKPGPPILDDALAEPLVDASTILRVKDRVARSQRDVDEDERNQFADPSLVVEAQTRGSRSATDDDGSDDGLAHLPDLFADEARRQQARLRDSAARPAPRDDSLFGIDDTDDDSDED